ncbi:hypothetical protein F0562_006501 [Nyssa sinensis]|uniref:SCP domain-containing protein n=1 Tax=Nyssa sinensis TaxID=561372 RepID=A0A5J5APU6_9ASTE|nr:hypothetical protein F0562_006501 [Nyssa sinensis]
MAKVLLALLALAICHSSFYGVAHLVDSRAPAVLPNDAKEYLKAHNQARAKVGVDPLKWSYSLANGASWLVRRQRNLNVCNFANITVTKYGVNQLLAGDRSMAPSNVVDAWVDEKKYYNPFYGVAHRVDYRAPAVLPNDAQEYLKAHNQARAKVGVSPLKWSYSLAKGASWLVRPQRNLNVCKFANITGTEYNIYGTNQSLAGDSTMALSDIMDAWVDEKKYYNYTRNSCTPNHKCGVYKQVVWRKSLELGCAQATCSGDGGRLTISLYNPGGNYKGQWPY